MDISPPRDGIPVGKCHRLLFSARGILEVILPAECRSGSVRYVSIFSLFLSFFCFDFRDLFTCFACLRGEFFFIILCDLINFESSDVSFSDHCLSFVIHVLLVFRSVSVLFIFYLKYLPPPCWSHSSSQPSTSLFPLGVHVFSFLPWSLKSLPDTVTYDCHRSFTSCKLARCQHGRCSRGNVEGI